MSAPPLPAVRCLDCDRTWNSASMADGLRRLGSCPRCGGAIEFREDLLEPEPMIVAASAKAAEVAPHLVLGIPRR